MLILHERSGPSSVSHVFKKLKNLLLTQLKERGNKDVSRCQRKENHTSTGEESCSGSRTSKTQPGGQLYQSQ